VGRLGHRRNASDPRPSKQITQRDWLLECLQGGRDHTLAACGVATLCWKPQRRCSGGDKRARGRPAMDDHTTHNTSSGSPTRREGKHAPAVPPPAPFAAQRYACQLEWRADWLAVHPTPLNVRAPLTPRCTASVAPPTPPPCSVETHARVWDSAAVVGGQ
jgi:hypothetical protein